MDNFFFLSLPNLTDRLFVKQFTENLSKLKGKHVLIYDYQVDTEATILHIGKRISGQISEQMGTNIMVSGDKRNLITQQGDKYILNMDVITSLHPKVNTVVIAPLMVLADGSIVAVNPRTLMADIRNANPDTRFFAFPNNSLSLLTQNKQLVSTKEEVNKLMAAFQEEQELLQLVESSMPCYIAGAGNFYGL